MPVDTPCSGCGRYELHKMCPAYGTPFYMSGIPMSVEDEKLWKESTPDSDIRKLMAERLFQKQLDEIATEPSQEWLSDKSFPFHGTLGYDAT